MNLIFSNTCDCHYDELRIPIIQGFGSEVEAIKAFLSWRVKEENEGSALRYCIHYKGRHVIGIE